MVVLFLFSVFLAILELGSTNLIYFHYIKKNSHDDFSKTKQKKESHSGLGKTWDLQDKTSFIRLVCVHICPH